MIRKIIFFENYFIEFYQKQNIKVKGKIQYGFELLKQVERVPEKFDRNKMDFMKSELNINQIFTEYFAVLIKVNW